jgi:ribose 5-phosphate isomerase A
VDRDREKEVAARAAVALVEDGMALGLGTGSTAARFVRLLGERVRAGLRVRAAATSAATAQLAAREGIAIAPLDELAPLDLAVDGADELDGQLRLIKGGGGALLHEKIVAAAARRFVIIADSQKVVATLGAFPLPVEVVPFGWREVARRIEALGGRPELRGAPFVTDGGHYILDCSFGAIADPGRLARALDEMVGVVEHGLFLAMAERALIGVGERVEERVRPSGTAPA